MSNRIVVVVEYAANFYFDFMEMDHNARLRATSEMTNFRQLLKYIGDVHKEIIYDDGKTQGNHTINVACSFFQQPHLQF
jgi:hypothetical protein